MKTTIVKLETQSGTPANVRFTTAMAEAMAQSSQSTRKSTKLPTSPTTWEVLSFGLKTLSSDYVAATDLYLEDRTCSGLQIVAVKAPFGFNDKLVKPGVYLLDVTVGWCREIPAYVGEYLPM